MKKLLYLIAFVTILFGVDTQAQVRNAYIGNPGTVLTDSVDGNGNHQFTIKNDSLFRVLPYSHFPKLFYSEGWNVFSGQRNTFKSIDLVSGADDTIGTGDNFALNFKVNNSVKMKIGNTGIFTYYSAFHNFTNTSNIITGTTDNYGYSLKTNDSTRFTINNLGQIVLPDTGRNRIDGFIFKGSTKFFHTYQADSTSGRNLFIGMNAGNFTMRYSGGAYSSSYNVGIGTDALKSLTTGYYNLAIGTQVGAGITTGVNNMGIGTFALTNLSTGSNNAGIGAYAMYTGNGSHNSWVGSNSGYGVWNNSNSYNTGVGSYSGYGITTGLYNTFVGLGSGRSVTTGGNNILIGKWVSNVVAQLSNRLTTGSFNIGIGDTINFSSATVSRELNIGRTIYGTGIYTDTSKAGINIQAPNSTLQVNGSLSLKYLAVENTYAVTATDYTMDCSGGTFTVTLPTAVNIVGRIYVIKNSSSGTTITVATTSSQTIDGATTYSLPTQYSRVTVQSNGANWIILSN